jgi:hypothetical protein
VGQLLQGGRALGMVQQLVNNGLEGVKFSHEFGIHGINFFLDLILEFFHVGIGGSKIKSHVLEGFLILTDGNL